MSKPKFYAYGIIQSNQGKNFGPIGVGEQNNEVVTVPYEDLALVISKFIGGFCAPTRQNLLQHEKVIVKVMEECTIIPMRFGHAFKSKGQIKNFLQKNYLQLKALLKKFIKKVELALKIHWKKEAFGEDIFEEDPELSSFQKKSPRCHRRKPILPILDWGKWSPKLPIRNGPTTKRKFLTVWRS